MYACVLSPFTQVWLFATLWTLACQAPLSKGFSSQEYWSGFAYKSLKASCQFYTPGTVIWKDLGSIALKYKHHRRQYVCLPVSWLQSSLWHRPSSWCCKTISFSLGWRQSANRDDLPPRLPTPVLKNSTACFSQVEFRLNSSLSLNWNAFFFPFYFSAGLGGMWDLCSLTRA